MLLTQTTPAFTPISSHHVTITRELRADLETPVSVYLKLSVGGAPSFLLESVTGGEQVARYSFIGVHPKSSLVIRRRTVERHADGQISKSQLPFSLDPLHALRHREHS